MVQTTELLPGVTLRCVAAERFRQGCLSVQFLRPMCREEAAVNALIPAVLLRGTKTRPDLRSITLGLDDLYGASVGALVRRIGDYQAVGLYCGFIEDRYALPGDRVLGPMIGLLEELLLDPVTEDGVFRRDYVQSEKRNLIATIESERNDKRAYAAAQMLRRMCSADSFGIPRLGEVPQVEAIGPDTAWAHYQKILRESPVEIFYVAAAIWRKWRSGSKSCSPVWTGPRGGCRSRPPSGMAAVGTTPRPCRSSRPSWSWASPHPSPTGAKSSPPCR